MKVFRWPLHSGSTDLAPHEMRMIEQFGGIKLALLIKKKDGAQPQTLICDLQGVAGEVFQQRWCAQGSNWQQTGTINAGNAPHRFFAIRYVHIEKNFYLVWRVEHIEDVPFDTLDSFYGSLADMNAFYSRNDN